MMQNWRSFRFPLTAAALTLFFIVVVASHFNDVNVIEPPPFVLRIEQNELDEIFLAFLFVVLAVVADQVIFARRQGLKRKLEQAADRVRVVQTTMRTVQDIVGNCLNQLQLLRLDAEGHVPEESLTFFDQAIQETSVKLTALGDLRVYTEKQMGIGTGLDVAATAA